MAENEPAQGQEPEQNPEKMWTQTEHDAYVKARIDKQRASYSEQLAEKDARIAELEAAANAANDKAQALEHDKQVREWAAQVSKETGVPASVIRGASLEEMQEHAKAIKETVSFYPAQQQGQTPGPVRTAAMTRDEIAEIKDPRRRIAAIKANIESYQ